MNRVPSVFRRFALCARSRGNCHLLFLLSHVHAFTPSSVLATLCFCNCHAHLLFLPFCCYNSASAGMMRPTRMKAFAPSLAAEMAVKLAVAITPSLSTLPATALAPPLRRTRRHQWFPRAQPRQLSLSPRRGRTPSLVVTSTARVPARSRSLSKTRLQP